VERRWSLGGEGGERGEGGEGGEGAEHFFFFCFLLQIFIFPPLVYYLKKWSKDRLHLHYTSRRRGSSERRGDDDLAAASCGSRQQCWVVQAGWLNIAGTSLAWCLGYSMTHILTKFLEVEAENPKTTPSLMLCSILLFASIGWLVSISTQSCSDTWHAHHDCEAEKEEEEEACRASKRCSRRYRVQMLVPVMTLMWIVFVSLAFESFFACAQKQLVYQMKWDMNIAHLTFVALGVAALFVTSKCCGKMYGTHCEEELLETWENDREYRRSVASSMIQTHEELLLGR